MVYILAAALSSLLYAIADNINGFLSRKNTPLQLTLWSGVIGAIMMLPLQLTVFSADALKLTPANAGALVLVSLLQPIGGILFLMGMRKGSVMLTGVIAGSFPVVTTLLALVLFNERLGMIQVLAVGAIFAGILLASLSRSPFKKGKKESTGGIMYAVGACLAWGAYFALVRIPVEQVSLFPCWSVSWLSLSPHSYLTTIRFLTGLRRSGF